MANLREMTIAELQDYISACQEFAGGHVSWTDADGRRIDRRVSDEIVLAKDILIEKLVAAPAPSPATKQAAE